MYKPYCKTPQNVLNKEEMYFTKVTHTTKKKMERKEERMVSNY